MKIRLLLLTVIAVLTSQAGSLFKKTNPPQYETLQTGDIVFQDTGGAQGAAIQEATQSKFTHCGVVFESEEKLYVLEAIQPVRATLLKTWKARSKIFHARRLRDRTALDDAAFEKSIKWGKRQIGKDYDLLFKWGDEKLYCSELVWKIYKHGTGIKLCEPKTFQAYFLQDPKVSKIIQARYGSLEDFPKNEPVVAPSDLAKSVLLEEVPRRLQKK
jgi:uncharacterized protein YycO